MQLAFGDCVLDIDRRELRRDGAIIHTRTKVFEILNFLIVNRDRVLSRDELLAHVWPDLNISDATLSSSILGVRRAIGDDGSNPKFIKTLRGQGFRFIADVTPQLEPEDTSDPLPNPPNGHPTHARDDSLSIAVLPFANLNDDPKLNYLANGLTDGITTVLSRFKAFTVIARNSSFQYQGSDNDIRKIGADLRVDYILKGSVRYEGAVFRATAQLIHAQTTKHLWAANYDGQVDQLFALQDDITQKIATSIQPEIDLAEIRQASPPPVGDLRAQEMAWRARALLDRARLESNPTLFGEAMKLAESAALHDPRCRQAWWTVCVTNFLAAFARQGDDLDATLARSREAAQQLRVLDRNDHTAYMALGWTDYIERKFEAALTKLHHAHQLNPNCTMTLMFIGVVHTSVGEAEMGYEHLRRAVRLSPRDLWLGFMLAAQGLACFALERYEDGAAYSRQAIEREPYAPANHVILAACLAESGDLNAAGAAVRAQRKINEKFFQEYIDGKRLPYQTREIAERYAAALRCAAAAA